MSRTSSCEKKVREATKEVVREMKKSEMMCCCLPQVVAKSCRKCMLRDICDRLLNLGYNCAICKSKWRSSSEIISGISDKVLTKIVVTSWLCSMKLG